MIGPGTVLPAIGLGVVCLVLLGQTERFSWRFVKELAQVDGVTRKQPITQEASQSD
jgi:hypothetical protein